MDCNRPVLQCGWLDCLPSTRQLNRRIKRFEVKRPVFPIVSEPTVDVWVIIQLIASISVFGFSMGLIIRGNKTTYDTVRAVIAAFYLTWAIIDASIRIMFRTISSCRLTGENGQENDESKRTADNSNIVMDEISTEPSVATSSANKRVETTAVVPEEIGRRNQIRIEWKYLSVFRAFLADFFLYPILLCHVLKYAASKNYDVLDFSYKKYEGSYFVILLGVYFVMVYSVRFMLVVRTFTKVIQDLVEDEKRDCKMCRLFCLYLFKLFFFSQGVFIRLFLHTFCHFLAQILLVVIVFLRAEYEFERSQGSLNVSPYFWATVVLVYIIPQLGFFTFFSSNYPHIYNIFYEQNHIPCCYKTIYLWLSPLFTVLSLVYSGILVTFLVLSGLIYNPTLKFATFWFHEANLSLNLQYFILATYIFILIINFRTTFTMFFYICYFTIFVFTFPFSASGLVGAYIVCFTDKKIF